MTPLVATEPEPVAEKEAAPRRFNLGAGLGLGSPTITAGTSTGPALPLHLSFEIGLTPTTWLMLNGSFMHASFEVLALNLTDPARDRVIRLTENTVLGTAGVRQIVVDGWVDLSVYAGVQAGNDWINGDALLPVELSAGPQAGSSALLFGAVAGVAVERELVEALALRIGVQALSLTWLKTSSIQRVDGREEETALRRTSFGLALEPSLELCLYF